MRILKRCVFGILSFASSVKKVSLELRSLLDEQKRECSERLNHAGLLTIMW